MTFLDETILAIRDRFPLIHLGPKRSQSTSGDSAIDVKEVASLRNAALLAFDGVREAVQDQADELRKLQQLGRVVTIFGILLLLVSCLLFLAGFLRLGAVSGIAGTLVEVLPVLIFRQIESARASFHALLPDSMHLFSMVVLLDYAERNPSIAKSIVSMFQRGLKKEE